ncbi:hypothetical protein [Streptomyces sp. cg2]|uniref:hypothetical protein n=1 Tax=Streptomyces sp. cg2 TaxID=3238799 RepID=UPI0034E27D7E
MTAQQHLRFVLLIVAPVQFVATGLVDVAGVPSLAAIAAGAVVALALGLPAARLRDATARTEIEETEEGETR